MSHEEAKLKHSKRRAKTFAAAKRQQKIATRFDPDPYTEGKELGRFMKRHALDCGNSKCIICGNSRRILGEKTYQEYKMEQDLDNPRKGFVEVE